MAEEATIRYIFIGHIASVLHFHWTVESISIWKIHKTAKSIGRSNRISGGVRLPQSCGYFEQTFSAAPAGWFGKKIYCVRNEPPFISKFMFLLCLNCFYSYILNQCPLQTEKFLCLMFLSHISHISLFIIIHNTSQMTFPFIMASLEPGGSYFFAHSFSA